MSTFFREHVTVSSITGSSGINTTQVDQFRQGVELVTSKHFYGGLVRIYSGEQDHSLMNGSLGTSYVNDESSGFFEIVDTQRPSSGAFGNNRVLLFVDAGGRISLDGVVDVLRSRTSVVTQISPQESIFKADIQGNSAPNGSQDRVLTVDYWSMHSGSAVCAYHGEDYFSYDLAKIRPYNDTLLVQGFPISGSTIGAPYSGSLPSRPDEMTTALMAMSQSIDTYIPWNKKSATCGWTYDGVQSVGTDSIAFGGLYY